ncbi:HSPA12-like nucleotide binding domain family protein, partial [Metarhizium robertsii]
MGYRTDHDGKSAPYYSFSTAMISAPHGLELAGLRPISQYGDEHYGLKESFDDRLCREEGPGKGFRDLCAKRGTTHWDALRLLLQDRWHYINNQIRTMFGNVDFEITEVVFTVPASQASDDLLEGETYGRDIQAGMTQCAIEAGIPENIIAPFRTEPEAIASYVAFRDAKPVKSRRRKNPQHDEARIEIVLDMGAGTTDVATYLVLEGRAILLRKPEGRSVGIGRLWHLWERECQSWVTDANPWKDISRDLRYHVHEMPEGCSDFKRGDKTIRASDFQKDLNDCCDKALRLLETELWSIDEAKTDRLRTSLDSICIRMREGGRKAEFEVDILDRKEDENAVARGASRPFSKNPLPGFRRAVVGVMTTLPVRSDAPIVVGEAPLQKAVLELKAPGKLELESGYEQMTVATEPDDFWIELQELMLLDKPLEGKFSDNTGRPYWSDEYAMPMGPQRFDLTGLRTKGDKVWVKLMRETSTLYVLEV